MDKRCSTAAQAVADIPAGSSVAVGGFGLVGIPATLIKALVDRPEARDLEIVSNNCGVDDWGLGLLLAAGRIRRIVASYVGENKEFARQYLAGELEVELTPQGTLAERLRAGGAGIAAFYTRTGVGTQVAEGGLPWRYDGTGGVALASPPKPVAVFDEHDFVLERALTVDVALVRAWRGDRYGNLVFRRSARNFNPLCARAARLTIAEVEEFVEPGQLDPDTIHLPGIHVDRIVTLAPDDAADKRIEKRTVTEESR
ncbi:CoA transferase subunit A [Streptomyces sp. NPDC087844]|uniref:CoA transferase subunit A n=1 Tax=Streptomyces sp. NPDC087844 TaxID=3365805 RepID=UPI0037FAEA88